MLTWNKLEGHAALMGKTLPRRGGGDNLTEVATAYVQKWAPERVVEAEMESLTLPTSGWWWLRSKLDSLNLKAVELGLPVGAGYRVMREFTQTDWEDNRRLIPMVEVAISGPRLCWEGWAFVGTISHCQLESGEWANIIRLVPGSEGVESALAPLWSQPPKCDHCHRRLHRKDTYLLQHQDGRWAQVGSDCLKNFLGHADPLKLAQMAQMGIHWRGWLEEAFRQPRQSEWGWEPFMAYVVEAATRLGFVPKSKATESQMATSSLAWEMMRHPAGFPKDLRWSPSPESVAKAQLLLKWALSDWEPAMSSYTQALKSLLKRPYLEDRDAALAASLYPHYTRAQESPVSPSGLGGFGEVGKRYTLTVEIITADTQSSDWGPQSRYLMRDSDGHKFTVWTSSPFPVGPTTIRGTVKAHKPYRGEIHTLLTRVALA